MFRGGDQAKIDNKGRLKIPAQHRQTLFKDYGPEVFMTIIRDKELTIYPLKIWEATEQKLLTMPDSLAEKHTFLTVVNFFGAAKTVDEQGRLLIPPHIREKAALQEEVAIIANLHTLQVLNVKYATEFADQNPLNERIFEAMSKYGF